MRRRAPVDGVAKVRALALCAVALLLGALFPEAVAACPVCFDARDENRQAFLATTAFLSLLPLGMVAGAGLWVRKRNRELDALHGGPAQRLDPALQQDGPLRGDDAHDGDGTRPEGVRDE